MSKHWVGLFFVMIASCKFPELPAIEEVDAAIADASSVDTAASADAAVDSPQSPAVFDVAYASEWRFLYVIEDAVSGYFLVINRGSAPLSMSTLQVRSISDDHPTALVRITATPSAGNIPPGRAAGYLTQAAYNILVQSALVPETNADTQANLLSLQVLSAPEGTYDIRVETTLSLDGHEFMIPMTIHIVPGLTTWMDPLSGTRLPVY